MVSGMYYNAVNFFLEEDGLKSESSLPPCLTTADLSDFKQHVGSPCANF